jgi:hypothetical protein
MKKKLLLAAALACSGAVAQEKEIWACQSNDVRTGYVFEDAGIKIGRLRPDNLLVTIDGNNSNAEVVGSDLKYLLSCEIYEDLRFNLMERHHVCHQKFNLGFSLRIGTNSGKAISARMGGIFTEYENVDMDIYTCTKF